jgi:hypothetical protein
MKGQRRFSQAAADQIRVLLGRTRSAQRAEQKVLRQRIRDLGFYISAFERPATGFGPDDFDELIRSNAIEIVQG